MQHCISQVAVIEQLLRLQVQRWLGEPVKAVLLHTSCYTRNKKGFPVLSKAHQELMTSMFQHNVQVGPAVPCA